MTSHHFREKLFSTLNDPACHGYLKEAICVFLSKDPVDAANDAAFLAQLMDERCHLVLAGKARHLEVQL